MVFFHYGDTRLTDLWPNHAEHPPGWAVSPVFALVNGHFAVAIFFVLSGFVLAASADRRFEPLRLRIPKRYLRLALPSLFAIAVSWLLNGAGLPAWVILRDGLFVPFFQGHGPALDGALWTMKTELFGSIAVYLICASVRGRARAPAFILFGIACLAAARPWYIGFAGGATLYAVRFGRWPKLPVAGSLAVAAGLILGGGVLGAGPFSPYERAAHALGFKEYNVPLLSLAAFLLVVGIKLVPTLRCGLDLGIPQWLGRTSFGLYLIHLPILIWLDRIWDGQGRTSSAMLFVIYLCLALAGGWAATEIADVPTLRLLRRLRSAKLEERLALPQPLGSGGSGLERLPERTR